MESLKNLLGLLGERLGKVVLKDAVVSKPLTVGNQHVVVLSELSLGIGAGGGTGEGPASEKKTGKGTGGAGGGGAKASPIAILVVEGAQVRLEKVGN